MVEHNIFRNINKKLTEEDIKMLQPLQLAYIGDAVYELLVRTYLLEKELSVGQLHRMATKYVKAKAQADIIHNLEEILQEKEKSIVKRGRNSKTNTMPKNAKMIDYKYATGFEALIGYLYLMGKDDRIIELFDRILKMDNLE